MDVIVSSIWLEMESWPKKKVTWTTQEHNPQTTQNKSPLEAIATLLQTVNSSQSHTKLMPEVSNQKAPTFQLHLAKLLNTTSKFYRKQVDCKPELIICFIANNRQVELHKKIAAEVEAEGQRILALQAQLAQNQPQQNQYQQQGQQNHGQQHQGQQHQGQQHGQQSHNYNAQASNQVYQQQQHSGYNSNAQPIGGAQPQQNYLPPQKYGKK